MMTPEQFSVSAERIGVKPVHRAKIGREEVYVADGFISPWQYKFLARFGISASREEYPMGCFATIGYVHRRIGIGVIELSRTYVQSERIKSILERAKEALAKERKAKLNG